MCLPPATLASGITDWRSEGSREDGGGAGRCAYHRPLPVAGLPGDRFLLELTCHPDFRLCVKLMLTNHVLFEGCGKIQHWWSSEYSVRGDREDESSLELTQTWVKVFCSLFVPCLLYISQAIERYVDRWPAGPSMRSVLGMVPQNTVEEFFLPLNSFDYSSKSKNGCSLVWIVQLSAAELIIHT